MARLLDATESPVMMIYILNLTPRTIFNLRSLTISNEVIVDISSKDNPYTTHTGIARMCNDVFCSPDELEVKFYDGFNYQVFSTSVPARRPGE